MRRHVVGYRFDDASAKLEGGLDKVFAVARRATALNAQLGAALGTGLLQAFQPFLYSLYGVALVGTVI